MFEDTKTAGNVIGKIEADKRSEVKEKELLEKINASLAELGSTAKWKGLPDFKEEYASLRDKKITIVDDGYEILQNQLPDLMVATDGKASFVHYKNESIEKLIEQIIAKNADIVLMDYTLSEDVTGTQVIKSLMEAGFTGKIIGYSSSKNSNEALIKSGAIGAVDKSAYNQELYESDSVRLLGELIKNLQEER